MFETLANSLVHLFYVYAAAGLLFALCFIALGISHIDHEADESSLGFRLIIVPGVITFWPLLAIRWIGGRREPPTQKDPHR
jgi:hypothetical protein